MKPYLTIILLLFISLANAQIDTSAFLDSSMSEIKEYESKKQYELSIKKCNSVIDLLGLQDAQVEWFLYRKAVGFYYMRNFESAIKAAELGQKFAQHKNLNLIGTSYKHLGEFKKAKRTYEKAKNLKEKKNELDIPYARLLTNLGDLYIKFDEYNKADKVLKTALKIKGAVEKVDTNSYSTTLFNLSKLIFFKGNYSEAIKNVDLLLELNKSLKKEDNEKYFTFLQFKGDILLEKGENDESKSIYEEVIVMRQKLKSDSTSNHAKLLMSLGSIYIEKNNYEKAKEYLNQALFLFEINHNKVHPYYAGALVKKATIEHKIGNIENAEKLYLQASNINKKALGKRSLEYFKSEYEYFNFLRDEGRLSEASMLIRKISPIIKKHIKNNGYYLTEVELNNVKQLYKGVNNSIIDLSIKEPSLELNGVASDFSMFYKSYVLRTLIDIRHKANASEILIDLRDKKKELEIKLETTLVVDEINQIIDQISTLDEQSSRLLGEIISIEEDPFWEDVINNQMSDEISIEFSRIISDTSIFYSATILKETEESPIIIKLFEEKEITEYLGKDLSDNNKMIGKFYNYSERGRKIDDTGKLPKSLYELIWSPMLPYLEGIKHINYTNDGILHTIALQALPINDEEVLLNKYSFVNKISLNDSGIFEYGEHKQRKNNKALLVGDVDFGLDSDISENRAKSKKFWGKLSGSEKEINGINSILMKEDIEIKSLIQNEAQKKSIYSLLSTENDFSIIHFATHGFYNTENLYDVGSEIDTYSDLRNSGLVFAGANNSENESTSILTAYEIAQLDLRNTDLVVVAACESGLGNISDSEGVYGLQRGLKIAGAKHIILSLWRIPDFPSKDFMIRLYENLVVEDYDIYTAFNKTQKEMKEKFYDPKAWAGFILLK